MIIDLFRHDVTCTKYPVLHLERISENFQEMYPSFYHNVSLEKRMSTCMYSFNIIFFQSLNHITMKVLILHPYLYISLKLDVDAKVQVQFIYSTK